MNVGEENDDLAHVDPWRWDDVAIAAVAVAAIAACIFGWWPA